MSTTPTPTLTCRIGAHDDCPGGMYFGSIFGPITPCSCNCHKETDHDHEPA